METIGGFMAKQNKKKWFRMMMAHNIAATAFGLMMDKNNRGPNFDVETTVDNIIEGQVETQAFIHKIDEKHVEEMTQWSKDFYNTKLKKFIV